MTRAAPLFVFLAFLVCVAHARPSVVPEISSPNTSMKASGLVEPSLDGESSSTAPTIGLPLSRRAESPTVNAESDATHEPHSYPHRSFRLANTLYNAAKVDTKKIWRTEKQLETCNEELSQCRTDLGIGMCEHENTAEAAAAVTADAAKNAAVAAAVRVLAAENAAHIADRNIEVCKGLPENKVAPCDTDHEDREATYQQAKNDQAKAQEDQTEAQAQEKETTRVLTGLNAAKQSCNLCREVTQPSVNKVCSEEAIDNVRNNVDKIGVLMKSWIGREEVEKYFQVLEKCSGAAEEWVKECENSSVAKGFGG